MTDNQSHYTVNAFKYFETIVAREDFLPTEIVALNAARVALWGSEDPATPPPVDTFFERVEAATDALNGFPALQDGLMDVIVGRMQDELGPDGMSQFEAALNATSQQTE